MLLAKDQLTDFRIFIDAAPLKVDEKSKIVTNYSLNFRIFIDAATLKVIRQGRRCDRPHRIFPHLYRCGS